jgi:hypothetical protein
MMLRCVHSPAEPSRRARTVAPKFAARRWLTSPWNSANQDDCVTCRRKEGSWVSTQVRGTMQVGDGCIVCPPGGLHDLQKSTVYAFSKHASSALSGAGTMLRRVAGTSYAGISVLGDTWHCHCHGIGALTGYLAYLISQSVDGARREGGHDVSAVHQCSHKGRTGGSQVQCHACRAGNGPGSNTGQLGYLNHQYRG